VDEVEPGTALTISYQTCFQFRNTGSVPLKFLVVTLPAWPGPDEAIPVHGKWPMGAGTSTP
jgi:mannose-6-phosphate isomerase-like protein (cupin superfamily)